MRRRTTLRTADVLAAFDDTPRKLREIADVIEVPSTALGGHITHLYRQGKITQVARGTYVLSEFGRRCLSVSA